MKMGDSNGSTFGPRNHVSAAPSHKWGDEINKTWPMFDSERRNKIFVAE